MSELELWTEVALSDIGNIVTGNTPSTKVPENYGGTTPFVKPPDLQNRTVGSAAECVSDIGLESTRVLGKGAVLVSCIGILGRTALATKQVAFNQQINAIQTHKGIYPEFIFYQAQSQSFIDQLNAMASATTISIVNKSKFSSVRIKLAPTNEQYRIVEKIDQLFAELDKGIESLKKAREQLKIYRQSLLKHTFEGKLTEQWRLENVDKLQSAEQLMVLIDAERSQKHQDQINEWNSCVEHWINEGRTSKKPTKPRLNKDTHTLEESEIYELPSLPSSWAWACLDQLVSGMPRAMQSGPFGSNLKHSEFQDTGVLVIGIDNVRDGEYSNGSQNRISVDKFSELKKYQARGGDLLVTVMASLGRTCVVPRDLETAIITKHVYRITMEQKYLLPEFYNLLLQSHTVSRNRMFANAQGQTRPGLNSTILRELPVPLCSLLEQTEIVERLDAKLDSLRKIEQEIEGELSRSTSLRQSILKKAFSGQLVPQDPEDEPASVLLERIEADKRAAELALQKKRKTKKAAVKRKNSTKKRSTRKTT